MTLVAAAMPAAGVRNRIDEAFGRGRPALIAYLPLGDPAMPDDLATLYVAAGVDVLEIGLPVANPYVDGATIRDSMARTRRAGVGVREIARRTAAVRRRHPAQAMVWMTYAPAVATAELVGLAAHARVDGVLFVEPARLFGTLADDLAEAGVHHLHFLGRELPDADVAVARGSRGYVMLAATPGATGEGDPARRLPDSAALIGELRRAGVRTPIALGIGVQSPAHARQAVEMGADGVIVGSELVRRAAGDRAALADYLAELRRALS